jgi:UDP-glucose 4-epimerase
MTISIVTGGVGFIGSHIVDRLVSLGHRVIIIDDESAKTHEQFYYNENAQHHKADIADYKRTRFLYDGVTWVFHLAAQSRIQPTITDPISAVQTNVMGTAVVLQCAKEAGVKKVVFSSTSSIYGLKNKTPLQEDMFEDCLNPYSVSKFSAERLCKLYNDFYDLPIVILRYFNVYGEREPLRGFYAPIVGLFLRQKKEGKSLTIVPDGHQRRDFVYVQDVVDANLLAAEAKARGVIINIGAGKSFSILELANMISSRIEIIEGRIGEARETLADISRAKVLLGWEPKNTIENYIKKKLSEVGG